MTFVLSGVKAVLLRRPHEGIVDMATAVREFLKREDIPDAAKRKISYDNAKKLYGL